ncbi:TolC family protein [Microbulbifer aggregans]|uniref:TolC family protein n=1 Tax=Microbulbifer aggregans TaxID=1769779 RepID=UPI001CFD127C|nr:TolC family protein [Microbulbifer aggregans]
MQRSVLLFHRQKLFARTSVAILLVYAVAFAQPVSMAQGQSNTSPLRYEQAILFSLQQHPRLAGFEFRRQAAAARTIQAGVGPRPELGVEIEDVAGTGDFSGTQSAQTTVGVSWLLQCDVIDKRVQAANTKASLIETEQQIAALDVAADTARYFLQALAQQDRLSLALRAKEEARHGLEDIRRQVQAGKLPEAEASRARAELERRNLAAEDVEHEYTISKHQLAAQWGVRSPGFTTLEGTLSAPVAKLDIAWLRRQVTNNPELAIFLNRDRIAAAQIELAKAEAGIQWRIDAGIRRLEELNDYSLVAGVAIPLGRRNRNNARVNALMAEQNQYRAEQSAQTIALETQVYAMAQQMEHSRHISEAIAQRIIPSLQRALADTRAAYQQGKYSYYELAAAERDLIDARLSLLEAQYAARLYWIEIEKLTGLSLSQPLAVPPVPAIQPGFRK